MRRGLATVLVVGGLAGVTLLPSAAGTATSAPRVTMFGDSVADSLEYVPEARKVLGEGLDLRLELAPCRRLVPLSCPYQGVRPPAVLDVVDGSTPTSLGDVVLVDVGYNDPANNYDTDMPRVVEALLGKGVGHIVWVTLREQIDEYRQINVIIRAQARRWPQVQVADWEAASRGQDWFAPDGLHLNMDGAIGLAKFLRPYVLAACGAACQTASTAPPQAPRSVQPPLLRGTPAVGRLLTCAPGIWTGPRPIVLAYRWLRSGRVLAGAVGHAHRLRLGDAGKLVACRVWASNASGATQATSKALRVHGVR